VHSRCAPIRSERSTADLAPRPTRKFHLCRRRTDSNGPIIADLGRRETILGYAALLFQRWDRAGLPLVGGVDPVELAQQSRPFVFCRFITAASRTIMSGADDLVGDGVERGARLLEGELHRTFSTTTAGYISI
jgi:hypothetical protein